MKTSWNTLLLDWSFQYFILVCNRNLEILASAWLVQTSKSSGIFNFLIWQTMLELSWHKEISGISSFSLEIFAYNTLLSAFATVLAVQLAPKHCPVTRTPLFQLLIPSFAVTSESTFISSATSAMGKACPGFALALLGVICASAQEVQPLTEMSLVSTVLSACSCHQFLHQALVRIEKPVP